MLQERSSQCWICCCRGIRCTISSRIGQTDHFNLISVPEMMIGAPRFRRHVMNDDEFDYQEDIIDVTREQVAYLDETIGVYIRTRARCGWEFVEKVGSVKPPKHRGAYVVLKFRRAEEHDSCDCP